MFLQILKAMRPHQWVKNLFVITPLIFALQFFETARLAQTLLGFGLFCLISGSVYLINDIVDAEADRLHLKKKNRPIASGKLPISTAKIAAGIGVISALALSFYLGWKFSFILFTYFAQNLAYSLVIKRFAYLDVLSIAAGFELRVIAGSFAAMVTPSLYLLGVTGILSAFLGFGKRLHEYRQGEDAQKQRKVLQYYNRKTLTSLFHLSAILTTLAYGAYTLSPNTIRTFKTEHLWVTTIFTALGLFRFTQLTLNQTDAESPTEAMLRDKTFILNLLCWGASVFILIYTT